MRRIDIWGSDRAQAVVLDSGLKARKFDMALPSGAVLLRLIVWKPKAINPFVNYVFKTSAERDAYLDKLVARFKDRQAGKMLQKLARQGVGVPNADKAVKVGDIFHSSWGYDQTNNDFYQVVAVQGRYAIVRAVGQSVVESTSHDSDRRLAVKDSFLEDSKPMKKLIQFSGDAPRIRIASYSSAGLWDGGAVHNSWGH